MHPPRRYSPWAAVPILSGLSWFVLSGGGLALLLAVLPGTLLLGTGLSALLYPGERRIPQYMALGALASLLFALPAAFAFGLIDAIALAAAAAGSWIAAGALAVQHEAHHDDVPVARPSTRLAAEVAADGAILSFMGLTLPMPPFEDLSRVRREVEQARELYSAQGWLEKPADYHRTAPLLEQPRSVRRSVAGVDFEHLTFESGYEPYPDEPGRDRWLDQRANRTAHAWALRHADPRPWLICIHGYQMGTPRIDLRAFQVARLHHKLGLNVLLPILPLHGERKVGRVSGDGFIGGDFLDSIHAEAQAMWDMRRLLSWVRAQTDRPIGVHGLSLGGYNTALLASLDGDLACAIPGIPATDFARLVWRHGPALHLRYSEHQGLYEEHAREILSVVSPLVLEPQVPHEHRTIFGGQSDLLVPGDQVRDLWRHWGEPRIAWYPGAHLTFGLHPHIQKLLDQALHESGLTAAA